MYGLAFALAELFAQGQLLYPYVPCVCTTSSGTLTSFSINKWVIVSEGAGGWWKVGGRDSREHRAAGDRLLRYLGTKLVYMQLGSKSMHYSLIPSCGNH